MQLIEKVCDMLEEYCAACEKAERAGLPWPRLHEVFPEISLASSAAGDVRTQLALMRALLDARGEAESDPSALESRVGSQSPFTKTSV